MPKKSLEQPLPVVGRVLEPLHAAAREQHRAGGEVALHAPARWPFSASRIRSAVTPMTRTRCPRNSSRQLGEPALEVLRRGDGPASISFARSSSSCGSRSSWSSSPRSSAVLQPRGQRQQVGRDRVLVQAVPALLALGRELAEDPLHLRAGRVAGSGSRDRSSAAPPCGGRRPVAARVASKNELCQPDHSLARPREEAELAGRAGRVDHDHPVLVEALEPAVDRRDAVERDRGEVVRRQPPQPPCQPVELALLDQAHRVALVDPVVEEERRRILDALDPVDTLPRRQRVQRGDTGPQLLEPAADSLELRLLDLLTREGEQRLERHRRPARHIGRIELDAGQGLTHGGGRPSPRR